MYLAAPGALVPSLAEALEWSCLAVSRIGQEVALAALQEPHDWVDAAVGEAELHATAFARDINAIPRLRCREPHGGLNVLVQLDGDATAFVRDLVRQAGVPAHPGEAFAASSSSRLPFGGTDAARRAAIERLAAVAANGHWAATADDALR